MVITSGRIEISTDTGHIPVDIDVLPRNSDVFEALEIARTTIPGAFLFDLDGCFSRDGRLLPTAWSSLGLEVPARARELWKSPFQKVFETVALVSTIHPLSHGSSLHLPMYDLNLVSSFLRNQHIESMLRLDVASGQCFEFTPKEPNARIPIEVIDDFIEFGAKAFGSYPSSKIRRRAKRSYQETNQVILGYVELEDSV